MEAGTRTTQDLTPWVLVGSYFEACNCPAICPCRRVGDAPGGSSTEGVCDFALSWHVDHGHAGTISLDGLDVVLAGRFYDDPTRADGHELGRWEVALYLDDAANTAQAAALEAIYLGREDVGSPDLFTAAIDTVHAVRRAAIELIHAPRSKRILVEDRVRVTGREPVTSTERITCGIPGHDQPGQEWVADVMAVEESGLRWKVEGKCAFASNFSYRSVSG